jgi:hypothetical protein
MATRIDDLTEVYEVTSADQIPIHSDAEGSPRKVTVGVLTAYLLTAMGPLSGLTRQAAAPSASPFTVNVAPPEDGASMRLIIKPTGTLAAGTINLPDADDAEDGQEVLITCTQIVTALTVAATGLNVTGAPTTLAANGFFRMMYDAVDTTWYRVG